MKNCPHCGIYGYVIIDVENNRHCVVCGWEDYKNVKPLINSARTLMSPALVTIGKTSITKSIRGME